MDYTRLRYSFSLTLFSVLFSFFLVSCQSNGDENDKSTQAEATQATTTEASAKTQVPATEALTTTKTEAPTTEATHNATATSDNSAKTTESTTTPETQKTPAVSLNFSEGQHYVTIFPEMELATPPGKISVIEMFWYGCPHCYELEPELNQWLSTKPANVEFTRIPATLNPHWEFHAKAYFAAQMLDPNNEKQLHEKIFTSIHKQKRRLQDESALKRFFVSQGIDESKFNPSFNSMEMNIKLEEARKLSNASQAHSVPTLLINGKYRTSANMAGSEERLFQLVNYLVAQESKAQQ